MSGREPYVTLHPKHGLNPMIPTCFFCGQQKNEILLLGDRSRKLTGFDDANAAMAQKMVVDKNPCDKCQEYMKQGVILITVDESKSKGDLKNPYRTGGWFVVKDEAILKIFTPGEVADSVLKARVAFIEHEAAVQVWLFAVEAQADQSDEKP